MPETTSLIVERNVPAAMRDGVTLYADVYRPSGPGPFPAILERTPYNKGNVGWGPLILRAVAAGYVFVTQDVRGRFESEGEFVPFFSERNDGYDTLEWLVGQPWCDGNIGMIGSSYVGLTQWQAALSGHPALKAIAPNVTGDNYHDCWAYQGGAFELSFNLSWTVSVLMVDAVLRQVRAGKASAEDYQALLDAVEDLEDGFQRLPLEIDPTVAKFAPWYQEWVDHPAYDSYWEAIDVSKGHSALSIPALNMGGWYDIFLKGTIGNFTGVSAREGQRLILGPWNHGGMRQGNPIGSYNFGTRSTGAEIDINGVMLRWYDHWLRGIDNGVDQDQPVRLFVMGTNEWRSEDAWPLARTDWQDWFLHSGGRANSLHGDGSLSQETPASEPPDSYVYNPLNPTPTLGGGLCCNAVFSEGGAYDQRPVESREDVLVYTTPPLDQSLEVTGPVKVILYASSSAPDTDFTAKLVDVAPCGYARNLTDGIIRARYRTSMSEPSLLTPDEVTAYEIDLVATSNVFLKGHRLRVEIASSNFPRFDRNPNTGELPGRSTEMVSAFQQVFHTAEYPSRIVLPVIPERKG